jgi:hypothetical protein
MAPPAHEHAVRSHYRALWGDELPVTPTGGRRAELPPAFAVLEFGPHGTRALWTYATCGMSQPGDERPVELHLFSPYRSSEPPRVLAATAHYHRTATALGVGDTVNFGRPWLDDSACDHGLISLPYLDGPALQHVPLVGGGMVNAFWLIPITRAEIAYKRAHGLNALEQRLEDANIDYVDPHRASVC